MTSYGVSARVLVATRNPGKLRELRAILPELGLHLLDLGGVGIAESPTEAGLETHATFEENALAKARYFHRLSGLPTVADDSGLTVDALDGAPGVRSKRYSGREGSSHEIAASNNEKLIRSLSGVSRRGARFVCAAAFVDGHREIVTRGETLGRIVDVPRGLQGFGYDPHFEADELGITFGEADLTTKQTISHRARAFRSLCAALLKVTEACTSVDRPARPD